MQLIVFDFFSHCQNGCSKDSIITLIDKREGVDPTARGKY